MSFKSHGLSKEQQAEKQKLRDRLEALDTRLNELVEESAAVDKFNKAGTTRFAEMVQALADGREYQTPARPRRTLQEIGLDIEAHRQAIRIVKDRLTHLEQLEGSLVYAG